MRSQASFSMITHLRSCGQSAAGITVQHQQQSHCQQRSCLIPFMYTAGLAPFPGIAGHASSLSLEPHRLQHTQRQAVGDGTDVLMPVKIGLQECPWIASERQLFGRPGGDYDWDAQDPQEAMEQYNRCLQEQQQRAKHLNRKVGPAWSQVAPAQLPFSGWRAGLERDSLVVILRCCACKCDWIMSFDNETVTHRPSKALMCT